MTSDCSSTHCSPESCTMASGCAPASSCSIETACLPSACTTSRCHTPSFLPRSRGLTGCLLPCYFTGSCNSPCLVGNCAWCEDGVFTSNEKETMQFLNDRLANYLEKVRSLEEINAELESRIQEQCEQDIPTVCPDYQCYFNTIEDLQQKILCTKAENSRLAVQLDNCKLATDDFKSKYGEKRFSPDNRNQKLTLLPTTPQNRSRMPLDVKWIFPHHSVTFFMPSHFQEVNLLRGQLGDHLSVELDTAPTLDLNRVLDEMRCQYETVLANNRREAEEWFAVQTEELNQQQLSSAEQLQGCQTEILELKRTANALEIELQAQQSLTESLECTVVETEAQYSSQLAQIQCLIDNVENQLAEIRCDLERQNQEYQVLLDVKARLEGEINTYRGLLDSEDSRLSCNPCSTTCTSSNTCEPCSAYVICTVENCCL
ncbi:PREDICTED: keratin, type I cytoskeletal 40 [Colobus angolensis palliatus]|uniref:keratin, type I cytoskeletal 40 n=1 Tax=Colobus angolensis palliatus TaxID=336983 RepID=UPI0005F4B404|nr:PREDICTED: keratin, type I cytoskeletal 40 [Colobus angolensis palliatus]